MLLPLLAATWFERGVVWMAGREEADALVWLHPLPRWFLFGLLAPLGIALVWWSVRGAARRRARAAWLAGGSVLLRAAAMAAVLVFVADPAVQQELAREGRPLVVVAIDDSLSMSQADAYAGLEDPDFAAWLDAARDARRAALDRTLAARHRAGRAPDLADWRRRRTEFQEAQAARAARARRGPDPVPTPEPDAPEAAQRAYEAARADAERRHAEALAATRARFEAARAALDEVLAPYDQGQGARGKGQGEASGFGLQASDQAGAAPTLKSEAWSLKPQDAPPSPDAVRARVQQLLDERAFDAPPTRRTLVVEALRVPEQGQGARGKGQGEEEVGAGVIPPAKRDAGGGRNESPGAMNRAPTGLRSPLPALLARLDAEGFEVRVVRLVGAEPGVPVSRVDPAALEEELKADGPQSPLGEAVQALLDQVRGRRLAGLVLITDGRETGARQPLERVLAARRRGGPDDPVVAVVGVGDPRPAREVTLRTLSAPRQVRQGALLRVQAEIESSPELAGRAVTARVTQNDAPVVPQRWEVDGTEAPAGTVTLSGAPRQALNFELEAEAAGEVVIGLALEPLSEEQRTDDNARQVTVAILDQKLRVLFLEGRPRFEWRHLVNALKRDTALEFQGFLVSAEQRWHQPASLRSAGVTPLEKLPATPEEWDRYDVVLWGDADPAALAEPQWEALERWVSEEGGGFVALTGQSHAPRADGPELPAVLRGLLAVEQGPAPAAGAGAGAGAAPDITREHRLQLTEAGRKHPAFRLGRGADEDRRLFETPRADLEQPGLGGWHWFHPAARLKPAAVALMELRAPETNQRWPALVEQPYGAGKTLWLASDETWRWRWLHGDRYYYRFWQNLLRHLAAERLGEKEQPFRIQAHPQPAPVAQPLALEVWLAGRRERELALGPAGTGPAMLRAASPDGAGEPLRLVLEPPEAEGGPWRRQWRPPQPGTWLVWIEGVEDSRLRPAPVEVEVPMQELSPRHAAWEQMARWASPRELGDQGQERAGSVRDGPPLPGTSRLTPHASRLAPSAARRAPWAAGADRELYRLDELAALHLPKRSWPLPPEMRTERLSDAPLWLAWIALLLALDWVLRRSLQLP